MIEMIIGILIGFYYGYGVIWSGYCAMSTVIHPSFPKMEMTPKKWAKNILYTTMFWPHAMYKVLKIQSKEAKAWKEKHNV